jgi:hypothetical protein
MGKNMLGMKADLTYRQSEKTQSSAPVKIFGKNRYKPRDGKAIKRHKCRLLIVLIIQ